MIAVPQPVVGFSDQGAMVYLADANNQVVPAPVQLGRLHEQQWLIQSGLQAGDRVILEAVQKLQPGMAVEPQPNSEEE